MERKTMGPFIAALRKANGMTQKELAEKLNVSDKTVSRWERDDGAPDLSAIPVIAEIFGVTCDELLRGQRMPDAQPTVTTTKGEKERRRILKLSLSKYRARTFIAMGVAILGLIAAMIGNLGFLRGYIGFFAGTVFYVASVICQAIFINGAFLSVYDDSLDVQEVADFRNQVIALAKASFGLTLVLFAASLPLVIDVSDTYYGLTAGTWFQLGLMYAAAALVLWGVLCWAGNGWLLNRGILTLDPARKERVLHNRKLKIRTVAVLVAVLVLTLVAQRLVNDRWGAWHIAGGTEFRDYESFAEYMEQPRYDDSGDEWTVQPVEPGSTTYYDMYGNEISEEEALREEIRIPDGTEEGKVVCTFVWRNRAVWSFRTSDTADGLPITAITHEDYRTADGIVNTYNTAFAVLYVLEVLCALVFYAVKRRR